MTSDEESKAAGEAANEEPVEELDTEDSAEPEAPPEPAVPPEAESAPDPAEVLEQVKAEAADLLQRLQRSQADLINYRRRVERESKELLIRVRANAAEQVLPTLDDFTLALKAVPPENADDEWIQGILLIERKLRGTLESWGLERIEALGKEFDPWEHEVLLQEEVDGVNSGQVIEVFRDGYKIEGKVIRTAQVKVAS